MAFFGSCCASNALSFIAELFCFHEWKNKLRKQRECCPIVCFSEICLARWPNISGEPISWRKFPFSLPRTSRISVVAVVDEGSFQRKKNAIETNNSCVGTQINKRLFNSLAHTELTPNHRFLRKVCVCGAFHLRFSGRFVKRIFFVGIRRKEIEIKTAVIEFVAKIHQFHCAAAQSGQSILEFLWIQNNVGVTGTSLIVAGMSLPKSRVATVT